MDTVPKIVLQNPYRILGVYANSRRSDIVANKGKATAFLKVNRPVEYPLDLKGILPALNRTLDLMNEAEAHLAIAKEQIKYAQFWFFKMTPIDDVAFNHLTAGSISGAKEMWSKQESLSSLQNKLVCYLIENKPWLAIKTAEKLYEKFGADYINKVDANCTLQMSATDLLHQFIDSLGEEIGMSKLLGYELGGETKAYISSQTVGPLISKISLEVEKAKKVDHKDAKARKEAARKLVANTKEAIAQLKSILPATDSQYQMIADKLGLEILQCGIDYFIGMKDADDEVPFTAMEILKYARKIVVGGLAIGRCDDQIRDLQKYIDNLPPKGTTGDVRTIEKEVSICRNERTVKSTYSDTITDDYNYIFGRKWLAKLESIENMLTKTRQPLSNIKAKTSTNNDFYVNISTYVASTALGLLIDVVNKFQNDPNIYSIQFNSTIASEYKNMLAKCWYIIKRIDDMDVTVKFANHYRNNRVTLKNMCNNAGVKAFDGFIDSTFDSDNDSVWWIASIVTGVVGLFIGAGMGDDLGAIIGGVIGFCLPWKYKEISER